jgi:radical SAM protein with 4Fe4S-binding SPASM domain
MRTYSAPFDVVLGITSLCNFSCRHCMAGDNSTGKNDLTKEEIFRLVDDLAEAKVFKLNVFGGEPLCRKDIFDILDHIMKYHFSVSMNTNASLITREIAEKIAGYQRIKILCVSLDGDSPETMDAMRGKGAFDKVMKGVENILSTGSLSVMLSATINKINFKRIRDLALLGRKIGVNSVRYNSVFFGGSAACNSKELVLSPSEHWEVINAMNDARKEFGSFVIGSYLQEADIVEPLKTKEPDNLDYVKVNTCLAGVKKCYISPDGWVSPCELICNVKAGNIREKSFLDIWRNSEVMKSFRVPMEYSLKEHGKCIACRYKRLCYWGHRCVPYYFEEGLKVENTVCLVD